MTFEWGRTGEEIDQAVAEYAERAAARVSSAARPATYNHIDMHDIVPAPRGESLRLSQPVGDIALGGPMGPVVPVAATMGRV